MICKNCKSVNSDSSSFCINCGSPLEKPENIYSSNEAQQEAQYQAPQQPQYQAPSYQQYQAPQQPQYQAPPAVNYPVQPNSAPPVSTGTYLLWSIGTALLSAIPIIGLIVIIVLACGKENKNRANYFKAHLILILIALGIVLVFGIIAAIAGFSIIDMFDPYYYF